MSRTLDYYNEHASEVAAMYEVVDFRSLRDRFVAMLVPGARILDVGSGSGRDAAALVAAGFDVTMVDGSAGLLREAQRLHPELSGRTHCVALPGTLPFGDDSFDAVTAWAILMHLERDELPATFAEIARVCRPEGVFAYSVNTQRSGLDEESRDDRGRRFTCTSRQEWERYHATAGFRTEMAEETEDIVGRPGIRWVTFIARRAE